MNAIIIDDEAKAIRLLEWELEQHCPDINIIESFQDPHQAIEYLNNHTHVDCIFLDITMPAMDGFSLLKQVKNRNFFVIFVTAHNEYAIQAIRENALDYILKPIITDELQAAVQKVKDKLAETNIAERLEAKLIAISSQAAKDTSKKLCISVDGKLLFIPPSDILYCESEGNYTKIYKTDGKKVLVVQKLKAIEEKLADFRNFFRIHNSFVVNLDKVVAYDREECCVCLDNDIQLPVSRLKRQEFLNIF